MSKAVTEPRVIDAYRFPQKVAPGCTHQLACKCDPPYWLRTSSPTEEAHEAKIQLAKPESITATIAVGGFITQANVCEIFEIAKRMLDAR